jgi:hypothetical protein
LWRAGGLENGLIKAHIPTMAKRKKWTICPAIGGKVAVAYRLGNGRAGNAL